MLSQTPRGRVLWVDDEPALLQVVSRSLEFFGSYEVILASHGLEALEKMKARPVDCVGSNIKMEPMDGVAMALAIREKFPTVPVLFLTALQSGWRAADQAGVSDYITKPFDVEELVKAVDCAIANGPGWRSETLREMPWRERGRTAQSVIERAQDNLAEVAEACVATQGQFLQAAEEGRLFSQSYAFSNHILSSFFFERGSRLLDDVDADAQGVVRSLWEVAQKGREQSRKSEMDGFNAVITDFRDGARVAIVTLPVARHPGEAYMVACVCANSTGGMATPRYFALEFQLRKDMDKGVLVERRAGEAGVVIRDHACPIDIDAFYQRVEALLVSSPAPQQSACRSS